MARPAADSVRVQWTGTGQGTMSLGAAVAGFQALPGVNLEFVSYSIENEAGTERENGFGTYTAAGTTLTRDFVTFSTAGAPTKVSFTGTGVAKHVRVTPLAHDVIENRAASDPGPGDDITDGYISGRARWLNTTTGILWFCINHTTGAAIWAPVLHLTDSSAFNPAAINLAANREFDPYPQTGTVSFALAAVTEVPGAWSSVEFTGNGNPITWSADFAAANGSSLTTGDYASFTGPKRLILMWSGTQNKALVALSGTEGGGGGGGTWGTITGSLDAQADLQAALDTKLEVVTTNDIADDAVTFQKLQNSLTGSRLIGRGQNAGPGTFVEISLGANLTMSGNTLVASGSTTPSADASTVTYTPQWAGAIVTNVKEALDNGAISGKYFGLNGNGSFNNTTVLHTALDAISAEGGGDLFVDAGSYVVSNIIMRAGVRITGMIGPGGPSSALSTEFHAVAGTTGVLFAGPASGASYGLIGLFIGGGSALGAPLIGAQFTTGTGRISGCYFSNFSSHCIKFTGGFQSVTNTHCNNGFYTAYDTVPTLPTAKVGVVHLEGGSDHTVNDCGIASRSTGKVSSADAFVCAVVVKSNGCWITGGDLHHCDVGLHIGAGAFRTQVHGVRIDSPSGNGIEIPSSDADQSLFTGVMVQRVGGSIIASPAYDSTNLYDGLNIQDPSGHTFVGCFFHGRLDGGVTPQMRYGINDTSSDGSNTYIGCNSANAISGGINALSKRTQIVAMQGTLSKVEDTVTGTYTLLSTDRGKTKRYTGAGHTWTVNNIGVGEIYIENAGAGTITFADGTSTKLGPVSTITSGNAGRLHLSNTGANYRITAA